MGQCHINISAPNLATICIDSHCDGEMSGRLYHCYTKEAITFTNVWQMLKQLDALYDAISFPQSSTETRYFIEPEKTVNSKPEKVRSQQEIVEFRGEEATFVVYVRYRQNSTWQGEVTWIEKSGMQYFTSTLEFVKLLDNALLFL